MARRRKNRGNERDKKNINKQGEDERKVKTLNEEKKRNVKNEAAARLKQTNKQTKPKGTTAGEEETREGSRRKVGNKKRFFDYNECNN